jgi:hypothetical protein
VFLIWKIRCRVGPTCRPHFLIVCEPTRQNPSPTWRPCRGAAKPRGAVALSSRSGRLSLIRAATPRTTTAAHLLPPLCDGALFVSSASLPLHSRSQVPLCLSDGAKPSTTSSPPRWAGAKCRCAFPTVPSRAQRLHLPGAAELDLFITGDTFFPVES